MIPSFISETTLFWLTMLFNDVCIRAHIIWYFLIQNKTDIFKNGLIISGVIIQIFFESYKLKQLQAKEDY